MTCSKVNHMISNRRQILSNLPNAFPWPLCTYYCDTRVSPIPTMSYSVSIRALHPVIPFGQSNVER
jgi:hypothetical protein